MRKEYSACKHGSAEKQGEHGQVREARGEGFVPSLLRGHPQHGPEDLHIGHNNEDFYRNKKSYFGLCGFFCLFALFC